MASLPPPFTTLSLSIPTSPPPPPLALAPRVPLPSPRSNNHLRRTFLSQGIVALLGTLAIHGLGGDAAYAFSLGISGPKDWLKGQKKKTAEYLLAPIIASRDRLKSAFSLAETSSLSDLQEAHKLVKVAARDCIKPQDGSLVAFQVKTGVEVCTFRLILKNAASLVDDADPMKLNADASLTKLISSFNSLDELLSGAMAGKFPSSDAVADSFSNANNALDSFEKGVRDCLGIL